MTDSFYIEIKCWSSLNHLLNNADYREKKISPKSSAAPTFICTGAWLWSTQG